MNLFNENETANSPEENAADMSRRSFFKRASMIGATSAVALSGFGTMASTLQAQAQTETQSNQTGSNLMTQGDTDILVAAQIAEALAVTTYSNIVHMAPFFTRLPSDDQDYLYAARQEEMSHYLLEQSVTG
jgi:hypothetical protein